MRLITLYRSFRPPDGESPQEFFKKQIIIVNRNTIANTILLGDFNLDVKMQYRSDYPYKNIFVDLTDLVARHNFNQIITFPTWSRTIKNVVKESTLDHIYCNNATLIRNCDYIKPIFGDHVLAFVEINAAKPIAKKTFRRKWKNYTPALLIERLSHMDLCFENDTVQEYWNSLENVLINIIDEIAPLVEYSNEIPVNEILPALINRKLNKRKKLLKINKTRKSPVLSIEIKELNREIKEHFDQKRSSMIKNKIANGSTEGLWKAVKIAKNVPTNSLPNNLTLNNTPVPTNNLSNAFAGFFSNKIEIIKTELNINHVVYNGKNKLIVDNRFFMSKDDVIKAMLDVKPKLSEGYDRLPPIMLHDARDILSTPFTTLFKKIYEQKTIPEQWKISKVIPIFKKGSKTKIENYRPISNLCSSTKIFERLILNQIKYLETTNSLDFTGKNQHGFKKSKSTATAGLILQSLISRAADDKNYVMMASLDLSAAFDLVNIELLLKRLRILGLPKDLIKLIQIWLTDRKFYVEIDGLCSMLLESDTGTVQGSVLGPILYAIFVSPLFDLTPITNFADDNFVVVWNNQISDVILNLERDLEMITKWLKDSGLKVNESKTETCLFHQNDQPIVTIKIQGSSIKSSKTMNVLGVLFDSKLTWGPQVAHTIAKANRALYAIRMIKKHFTSGQIKTLLTSYFYSVLYYNSEIWLTPSLCSDSRNKLLSASGKALQSCLNNYDPSISYINIHKQFKQPTPNQIGLYKLSLQLHKTFNTENHGIDWLNFATQIVMTGRQSKFEITKTNRTKIGINTLCNKFYCLNKQIDLTHMNLTFPAYKYQMKQKYLM